MAADEEAPEGARDAPALGWGVFNAVPETWPSELASDLDQWKQGYVVTDVPVTWLMPPGPDEVTYWDNDADVIVPADEDSLMVAAAVICSQTCDISATGPGVVHPFVLLAPLVPARALPNGEVTNLAREGKVGYLLPVLAQDTSGDPWYADLRLIFPASKAILSGRTPRDAFATEADSLTFGETLAQKFRRAALSDHLSVTLPNALRKFVKDRGSRRPEFRKVEQVRLAVIEGNRLFPHRAHLYVYGNAGQPLTAEEQEAWSALDRLLMPLMKDVGITMTPTQFVTADRQPADIYRRTVPVWCDLLGPLRYP